MDLLAADIKENLALVAFPHQVLVDNTAILASVAFRDRRVLVDSTGILASVAFQDHRV